jgi:hypothetical protein
MIRIVMYMSGHSNWKCGFYLVIKTNRNVYIWLECSVHVFLGAFIVGKVIAMYL